MRYPEGFRSTIDAALTLRGNPSLLVLGGNIVIKDGVYTKRFEPNVDIFALASGGGSGLPAAAPATRRRCRCASTSRSRRRARCGSRTTWPASARAPISRSTAPTTTRVLFGRADIDRGEIFFEGNRYRITRGTIDFLNPARIQPFFDLEAETRIRVLADPSSANASGAETYRITVALSGTLDGRMNFEVNSDPPLPAVDIISLMFGQTSAADLANPELRRLRPDAATQSEEQLLKAGLLRVLTGGLTGSVSRVVEQSLGIDTVQITPSLGTSTTDPLTPTARLILGKRHLEPRLPHLLARARHDGSQRPGRRPRIRPVRPHRLRVHAEWRPHLLDRLPRAEDLLVRSDRCWRSGESAEGALISVLRVLVVLCVCRPPLPRAVAAGGGLRRSSRSPRSRSRSRDGRRPIRG